MIQTVQHSSSIDSLEQHNETLHFISGCHKWIKSNDHIRVENSHFFNDNNDLIYQKNFSIINKNKYEIEDDEDISNSSRTDSSLNHFDVQLQVNNGQLQRAIRYEVFSTLLSNDINKFKINQSSQTIEPEMDMDNSDRKRNGNSNGYSQQYNNGNNNDGSYQRNRQTNGSSGFSGGGNADGNGSNPNRNNNNSRR